MSLIPWSRLIDFETVMELHAEAILRHGGDPTPTAKDGCVERSLGAAWNAELYLSAEDAMEGLCSGGCIIREVERAHGGFVGFYRDNGYLRKWKIITLQDWQKWAGRAEILEVSNPQDGK